MDFKDLFYKLKDSLSKISEKNKKSNHKETSNKMFNLIVIILIGAILMIAGSGFKGGKENAVATTNKDNSQEEKDYTTSNDKDYEVFLQNELKRKLEKIQGVGRVEVMIYFESGEEKVPAVNIANSNSITNEEDTEGGRRKISQNNDDKNVVITNENGNNKPLIIRKNKPKVTGVLVVAEGVENKITELRISKAVCALFNISNNKVNVYPMKK